MSCTKFDLICRLLALQIQEICTWQSIFCHYNCVLGKASFTHSFPCLPSMSFLLLSPSFPFFPISILFASPHFFPPELLVFSLPSCSSHSRQTHTLNSPLHYFSYENSPFLSFHSLFSPISHLCFLPQLSLFIAH